MDYVLATPIDGPIVEIGCGRARQIASRRDLEQRAIGVDVNSELLARAKRDNPSLNLVAADAEHLPFRDGTFAGLLSVSVLQYVDHERTLTEAGRVLHPGARISLLENLLESPIARAYRALHRVLGLAYGPHVTPRRHLSWDECQDFERRLNVVKLSAHHLTTPVSYVGPALRVWLRLAPSNRTRLFRALSNVDHRILSRTPSLARYCWMVSVLAEKAPEGSP